MEIKKKWYQSSIGIIALFILFFPVGLFLMWKYSGWNKVVKVIITGFFGLMLIGSASSSNNSTQTKTTPTPTTQTESVAQPSVQVTKQPEKPMTMTDKLWKALDDSMKTRDGYTVEFDESSKTASVTHTSTSFWDENSLVKGSFTTLVKFGKEVFKIDGVDSVRVVVKTEFTDQYGKKNIEDAVRIIMLKSEFNKFQWENLAYQPVYSQIKNASETLYIHSAIMQKLDPEKLYLSL